MGKTWFFIGMFFLFSCSDSAPKITPESKAFVKISMATAGLYNFENYIQSLQLYAFRETAGKYVFYRVLADLDAASIRQLESASSEGGEHWDTKLFQTELPLGSYRIYAVGNIRPEGKLEEGVTLPEEVYLTYPEGGIYWSYFLGEAAVETGETSAAVSLLLQRAVSRLFVKVEKVPWQIDTVTLAVGNLATKVALTGKAGPEMMELSHPFQVKAQDMYETDTAVFDLYSFPTVGTVSDLKLIFHSRSGEERIKTIGVRLLPDRYLYVTAEVSGAPGSLLSFDISLVGIFAWDWRDIKLPDFSLKPYER